MYEAEVNGPTDSVDTVPPGVRERLREYRNQVEARTLLPWGEHCTECAWPSCYTTCELYEPRLDGGCRQFVGGVTRIPNPDGTVPYVQKITFRRWAKLWTLGRLHGHSLAAADLAERLNIAVGSTARHVPLPVDLKHRVLRKVSYIRRQQLAERTPTVEFAPDYLVFEVYNPSERHVTLTLSVGERASLRRRFQQLISIDPGFTREKIPFADISAVVPTKEVFEVELVPNDAEGLTLYFGLIDFVKERKEAASTPAMVVDQARPTCKCVVWDLDNTLWHGVLIEDGPPGIRLREGIREVIEELDRRGILQSVASKNNRDDVIPVLEKFGLADYFLYPQVHWQPKSASVRAIAEALNIGIDTFLFVDDQEFERREVAAAWPQLSVMDSRDALGIPKLPSCQVPVTEESSSRRLMYRQQEQREAVLEAHGGDYLSFLKSCGMRVELTRLNDSNLQRVYELAQRTNQMNFSGNRYAREVLRQMMHEGTLDTYVLRCSDRFGAYGIVGFAVVRHSEPRLLDLMFSCRVQSKRVEHAFLAWLLNKYIVDGNRDFFANLRKTPKNEPSSAVFREMGFDELDTENGVTTLAFRRDRTIPDDGVVEIQLEAAQPAA
jgi:FkbH-like protein